MRMSANARRQASLKRAFVEESMCQVISALFVDVNKHDEAGKHLLVQTSPLTKHDLSELLSDT
jgi:hypothetical protein